MCTFKVLLAWLGEVMWQTETNDDQLETAQLDVVQWVIILPCERTSVTSSDIEIQVTFKSWYHFYLFIMPGLITDQKRPSYTSLSWSIQLCLLDTFSPFLVKRLTKPDELCSSWLWLREKTSLSSMSADSRQQTDTHGFLIPENCWN